MVGVQQTITSFPSCIPNNHPVFVEDLFTTVNFTYMIEITLFWELKITLKVLRIFNSKQGMQNI